MSTEPDQTSKAPETVEAVGGSPPPRGASERLRRLPWARLVAEFGVIFLGVTLGLLADDWRESRGEQEREGLALESLLDDLAADSIDLDSLRVDMGLTSRSAMWLRQNLGQPGVHPDSAILRIASIYDLQTYQAARPTYEGLRSSGELILIRDDDLRRAISYYYDERQQYILDFYQSFGPLWVALRDAAAPDWTMMYGPDAEDYALANAVGLGLLNPWSAIPTRPDFMHRLDLVGVLALVIRDRSGDVIKENVELREAIREYRSR